MKVSAKWDRGKKLWAIRFKRKVIGMAKELVLRQCKFNNGSIEGEFDTKTTAQRKRLIRYNTNIGEFFYVSSSGKPIKESKETLLNEDGKVYI